MIPISPFLEKIELCQEHFIPGTAFLIGRIPELTFTTDRKAALLEQLPLYRVIVEKLFPSASPTTKIPFVYADECHSTNLALITPPMMETKQIDQVDGLMTTHSEVILGITVADCAPVWILEKKGRAGALIHSGKRGTELGIVPKAIAFFEKELQIAPSELVVTIGPCIRPPCYEVDFATTIGEQAAAAGVLAIHDNQTCTSCHLDRYYSYRREKGSTGHMLAVLKLTSIAGAE
ncbi:MAG: polyphenol oxidase family protein [Chthoniobacterales bacterium]|nr:polyphenol oxidase family protein [Chthoniobacterales bacterium]